MSTTRKSRWRNSRNTIPGQRHQRRHRRRHVKRGGTYYPMVSDTDVAKSGIVKQLRLGTFSVATAVVCFILSISSAQFMILAFLGLGFIALAFGIALIASARREEKLHLGFEKTDRLEADQELTEDDARSGPIEGRDGSL